MTRLILETQISIDGYIADEHGGTDWMIWNWGPDWNWDKNLQAYHTNLNKSAANILISAQMACEGFMAHWQQVAQDPADARYDFASHIIRANKFVVSHMLTKEDKIPGGWINTNILNGNPEEKVVKLKNRNEGHIIVYGGATLVSSLIAADLIDDYHFIINPVALGNGLSIFKQLKRLKLVAATAFQCGVIVSQYQKPS